MTIELTLYGFDPFLYQVMTGEPELGPAGPQAIVFGTIADLYGMPQVEAFSLYGVDPHCDCDPMAFCRNPLHPGPCKGWKRTLGAVAPGALHALERDRIAKAEERRKASVKKYTDAGKKVPARLLKPITSRHLPTQAGAGGSGPNVPYAPPGGFQKPAGLTRSAIDVKVATRRADIAKIGKIDFMKMKASDRLDVYRTLKDGDVKAMSGPQRDALEGDLGIMVQKFKDPANKTAAERILRQVKAVPESDDQKAHKVSKAAASTPSAPGAPASRDGQGKGRDGDGDGKKNEAAQKATGGGSSAPAAAPAAAQASPAATLAPGTSAAAKDAHAVATRTAPGARVAKKQVEAYSLLHKNDFDSLPDASKQQIQDDLEKAHAKFLDPNKRSQVEAIQKKLGLPPSAHRDGGKTATPTPAAPSAPAGRHAAGPGRPSASAVPNPPQAGPSHEAIHAADALDQINHAAQGKKLIDSALKKAATQWDTMDAAGRKDYAAKFGEQASGPIAARLKSKTGIDLSDDATKQLGKEMADHILGGPPSPLLAKVKAATDDPNQGAALAQHLAQAGLAKPHGLEPEIARIFDPKADAADVASRLDHARFAASTPQQIVAVQEAHKQIRDDLSRPAWLRARAHRGTDEWRKDQLKSDYKVTDAVNAAVKTPSLTGEFRPTGNEAGALFRIPDAELAKLHPSMRDAIKERRGEAVEHIYRNTTRGGTEREDFLLGFNQGHPGVTGVRLDDYNKLTDTQKGHVRDMVAEYIDNQAARGHPYDSSAWQTFLDKAEGTKYNATQQAAIDATVRPAGFRNELDHIIRLSPDDLDKLPDAHALNISDRLEKMAASPDVDIRTGAALKLAEFQRNMPDYTNGKTQAAALAAGVLAKADTPESRADAFTKLQPADFQELTPAGKIAVPKAIQALVDDPNSGLPLEKRGQLQLKHDAFVNKDYDMDQVVAAASSIMDQSKITEQQRLDAYDRLTWTAFDDLPRFFRGTINDDLERLRPNHPQAYDRIKQRIDPSHVPAAPVTPTHNQPPHVVAALDVVYGTDPKSKQAPHQMKVYGGLRAADFGSLGAQEQNTILGDLSYIETTSKSADAKARARKLIDRFTPSGTPLGTQPAPMIVPPANATSNQTRLPDPAGVTGLLKESTNPGKRGDEWMTPTKGRSRVWGKYGAAGLMVRHVDPQTGEERFLIAQRGPAISDPGKWQLPGGAMESLETSYEGATRETREELGLNASHFTGMRVHGHHEAHVKDVPGTPTGDWKYTSVAATTSDRFTPDLSAPGARAETSDAKWMTRAEIDDLDRQGKLIGPLAGGKLQQNILSLFPPAAHQTGPSAPGPVTRRPTRLPASQRGQLGAVGHPSQPQGWSKPHKQSKGTNLAADHAAQQALGKQIGQTRKNYRGKSADERLAAIGEVQGFNDTPTVVSQREMDRLLATGDYIEGWRGVNPGGGKTADQIAEEFRSGPSWYGTGIFGNGYYIATKRSVAEQYAGRGGWGNGNGAVIRVLIPKDAKMTDWDKAHAESKKAYSSSGPYQYTSRRANGTGTFHDEGRLAAAQGHDGILIEHDARGPGGTATHIASRGKPSYNWLNRSVLIVQEA